MPKMHFCENFRILRNIIQYYIRLSEEISRLLLRYLRRSINIHYFDAEMYFSKKNPFRKKFSNLRNDRDHRRNLSIFPLPSSWFYRHLSFRCRDVFFKEESSSKKFSNPRNDRDHRKKSFDFSFPLHDSIDTYHFDAERYFLKKNLFRKNSSKYFDPTRITRRNLFESKI